ncbi:McrC family protein [Blastopirellula marina]|uniref:McrC family protein n=1 Tax=Blastopirellula marina TaxID=124 RepID=UPI001304C205|nr:hypothetical protein [Blastopirellula marina]
MSEATLLDLYQFDPRVIRIQRLPNGLTQITANSLVGRQRIGAVDLVIKPKTSIPALLTILAETHDLVRHLPDLAGFDESPEIVDLLIRTFLSQVDHLSQRGLRRSYVNCEDQLVPVRGRLDVRRTMALHMQAKPHVWCAFDEFTLDVPANQVLLTTLRAIIANSSILPKRRKLAHQLSADFAGVSELPIQRVRLGEIAFDRLNMHYKPALNLAQIILASMGIANSLGGTESNGFFLNMNELFEVFVFRRLAAILHPAGVTVRDQHSMRFDKSGQAEIRPDLIIQAPMGRRLAADTKYKTSDKPQPSDLYQMLAYCRVMGIDRGLLITVGQGAPRTYQVCDGETSIEVIPVDLDGTPNDIMNSLTNLANWIRTVGLKMA